MNVTVASGSVSGKIIAPPSKSYAHRLMISAFLSNQKTLIKNVGNSQDVKATIDCLNAFGGNLKLTGGNVTVYPVDKDCLVKNATPDCVESGSTLRFLIPLAGALGINTKFICHGRLANRPNEQLIKVLGEHGVKVEGQTVSGKLESGIYKIDASVSSQYITGLLMALPILEGDSEIILTNQVVSKNYIDITLEVLDKFKIKYTKTQSGFKIYGNQRYISPKKICCEGDWSGSAFLLALGVLSGKIKVKGLKLNSKQGDAKIIEYITSMGGDVTVKKNSIVARKSLLKAIKINLEDQPDLAPILSVLCANAKGISEFYGIERLRIKESDRIQAIISMLNGAGIKAEYCDKALSIAGSDVKSGEFNGFNDHRIAMSSAVLAVSAKDKKRSVITDRESVKKSYPQFFEHLVNLGVKIDV